MRRNGGGRAPDYDGRYAGSVAVVSGASSGLGRHLALGLARAGAVVVAVGRRKDVLVDLAHELEVLTPGARAAPCDVRDTEALTALLADVEAAHGHLDILVNNAGTDPGIRLSEIDVDDFRRTLEVNFVAAVAGTLAVLPGMRSRGRGIVANVSSDGGRLPSPGPGAYPASKAALSAFTESVSFRVERQGVRLHVVYPAWMPTTMGLGALQRGLRHPPRFTRRTEDEVARLVLARLGGPRLEISASRLIDAATVFRAVAPSLYHRLRRTW
ncbi:MAG TPA: SDR family oxidoreductase [Acidimicrobiales bacterium]|nr:SDR family oxidoreductase [Acidimicrobiales bacterium]